jgi:leucyl-tRNA synthetase
VVEQRELTQWFFKITDYRRGSARRARHARPLAGQGPPDAAQLDRQVRRPAPALRAGRTRAGGEHAIEVFTTRPDTLFGASFIAIAADHPLAKAAAKNPRSCRLHRRMPRIGTAPEAIDKAEKLGFDTGIRSCIRSIPGWTLPVYVANFVLMDYGTGAIFGCPAHDQRDLDFARKYGLPVIPGGAAAGGDDPKPSRSATRPMSATAR